MDDFRFEDLRIQIYPQSGANSTTTTDDTVAARSDGATNGDSSSVSLTENSKTPESSHIEGFSGTMKL